ncbi:Glucosyl/glucuronosyl transferase [Operophtera brumata]|uniref:Glucosyl/glucuronosyl transferase n=1 Tax=Operophtera brumata TaxID=104452 RepID=A0A0L7LK25_OPEBR|nr:Glucosyl/glucuronosyl transferase [Operophtera brumata]
MPLRSHYMAFQTLFRELANRGHDVTVMNNFPDDKPVPNLRFIDLQANSYNRTAYTKHPLHSYEHVDSNIKRLGNVYGHTVTKMLGNDCENLFINDNAKAHLAEGVKYDVIFVEQFISDCGLVYAAALYDAPIIGITSHTLMPWSYPRLGISFDFAADAFYFSNAGPNPSILHKVEAVLIDTFLATFGRLRKQITISGVFGKYLPEYSLDVERVAKERMKMMFAYQHFSVTGARVLPPQVLEIGGIHVGKPKPVTPDLEKFLSDATHGAVYVSFGSNLKANTMSEHKLQQFLTAFKRLPYKFIWKYENATFTDDKIYTGSWFPQLDILCNISETTHCGKPILTVPFFGDQFSNSAAVRAVGLGRTLFFNLLNADNLEETIRELASPEMQQNAQRISRLWHDRPQPVMDSAIYWTEYVARHAAAPPSLPAKHNTWFEGLLIDVYIVILGIVFLLGLLAYAIFAFIKFIVKWIVSLFRKKKVKGE